jgi:leucyl aminopeptidase
VSTVALSSSKPTGLKVDAIVVGIVKDAGAKGGAGIALAPGAEEVDKAFKGRLAATLVALGATGKENEVTKVASLGAVSAPVVVAVGLGAQPQSGGRGAGSSSASYAHEVLRRATGAATRALAGTASVGLALPAEGATQVAAVAEGALLGAYSYGRYRVASVERHKPPVEKFTLLTGSPRDKAVKAAVSRAATVIDAVRLVRDLVNTAPADLPPAEFATRAVAAAKDAGVDVEVLDEKALKKGGYGGILGVGQGSSRPPRLVRLTYKAGRGKPHLALVGKGITFDTGGLSLKPAAAMEWMKSDMGGAAAVIAAVTAIARLDLDVNVTAWAPMAENMPSGTAQRPSDVLTIYGGKTVEVLNTDAEGRLILADAIVRAAEDEPDYLIETSTLTGAQIVALGTRTAGVMGSEVFRDRVAVLGREVGEDAWTMPLPDHIRSELDSRVADLANVTGSRNAGMLVAGVFLREFVPNGLHWAHIDIAGPSFHTGGPYGYTTKGGTGVPVRTLAAVLADIAENG